MKDFNFIYKVIVIGDSNVGKTALSLKYTDDIFNNMYRPTIGIDFRSKTVELEDQVFKVQIWDTAGQEKYRSITRSYYRGANGIILVYDVTCRKSFNNVEMWLRSINQATCTILVGNKCDAAEREVPINEAISLARQYDIKYYETSAMTGSGVNGAFEALIRLMYAQCTTPTPSSAKAPEPSRKCC